MADIREQLLAAFEVEYREHVDAIRGSLVRARAGESIDLREVFRRAHSLKGAARAVDLPEIEDAAHTMEAQFAAALEKDEPLGKAAIEQVSGLLDVIERQAAVIYRRDEPKEARSAAEPASTEFLRVNAAQVTKLSSAMHELSSSLDFLDVDGEALHELQARAEALALMLERRRPGAELDNVAKLSAEARAIARGLASTMRQQRELARHSVDAAGRVREEIERIALVPASSVFGGLESMIRDVASEAGRDVEVRIEGLDAQADRMLLQSLRDPVIHLLRNAVAHGIETGMERMAAGKPAQGLVGLSLRSRAGRLEITVYDDGRGPDLRRIEEVAVARGLLSLREQGAAPPSPERLLALTFEPGFSTSERVDRVAGRGMGLSVVAEAGRRAGGGARMRRRTPWGTEVVVSTPLSAARQPVLLAFVGERTYGLPTHAVERVLRVPVDELKVLDGRRVVNVQEGGNQVLAPVVPLGPVLGNAETDGEETGFVNIAVLRQGDQRLGVSADAFGEVRTATVTALTHPDIDELVQGAVQLEQDQVAVVINPEALLRRYARSELSLRPAAAAVKPAVRAKRTILVVDDSVTTRTLEKSVLESNGFTVVLAVDGVDALEKLRTAATPIDLVVADVEMPRMDGFQLLSALKGDSALGRLPVIMMTSRASPDDIRRGMELGADAYLVKQAFDQRELLSAIRQVL